MEEGDEGRDIEEERKGGEREEMRGRRLCLYDNISYPL